MEFISVSFQKKYMYVFGFNNNVLEEAKTVYGNIHIPSKCH